jgi:hypothetical protein
MFLVRENVCTQLEGVMLERALVFECSSRDFFESQNIVEPC